jgi:hypothetical protein
MTPDAFWSRVDASGDCWLWQGSRLKSGYGSVRLPLINRTEYAHRYAWQTLVGPIPEGLQIDHRCRVRACVNPDHMEVVAPVDNVRRGYGSSAMRARQTHCKRGHLFSSENTYLIQGRWRGCKICRSLDLRARYLKKVGTLSRRPPRWHVGDPLVALDELEAALRRLR